MEAFSSSAATDFIAEKDGHGGRHQRQEDCADHANSGLGSQCGLALAKQDNFHVILAGRNKARIDEAVEKAQAVPSPSSIIEGAIVNLASLKDGRQFARGLIQRDLRFYTIVCNAGVQYAHKRLTEDGFEAVVGVNHTAHFLLLKYLMDRTQRIIMVSSGTHDPTEFKHVKPLDLSNIHELATGLEPYDMMQAYAASKLCNVLYTKEFVRRFPSDPEILVYTPGLMPDTELFRDFNFFLKILIKFVAPIFSWWNGSRSSTSAHSGRFLARMAAESWEKNEWTSGDYGTSASMRWERRLHRHGM